MLVDQVTKGLRSNLTYTDLEQLALRGPERDERHLAGVRVNLLHQQRQPRRPGLPVLQLVLGTRVISLQPGQV